MDENKLLDKFNSLETEMAELRKANETVLKILYDNMSSIGLAIKMKQKGTENSRYIKGLRTADIIQDYIKNDYHITAEMKEKYKKEYGVTYNGIRNRLIQADIWKDNRKDSSKENKNTEVVSEEDEIM